MAEKAQYDILKPGKPMDLLVASVKIVLTNVSSEEFQEELFRKLTKVIYDFNMDNSELDYYVYSRTDI